MLTREDLMDKVAAWFGLTSFADFKDRINTYHTRERLKETSGVAALYAYLHLMGSINRAFIKHAIKARLIGQERDDYLYLFMIYDNMKINIGKHFNAL